MMTSIRRRALLAASALLILPLGATGAAAEGQIRLVEQFGITYLPFHVIRDQGLLEQHGEALGVEIAAEWVQLSGGAAANDALLSGSVDIVAAGVGPLLTIWDRTRGTPQEVRGIVAGGNLPFLLVTNNPNVRTIEDFGPDDRIALPAVQVSVQARALQIAAAAAFGDENYDQLDALTVSLPHPDATQALLSRSGAITAHFSNAPFQYQALQDPEIRVVLNSNEVLGGKSTSNIVYTTAAWREANPLTYQAFLQSMEEAATFIAENPEEAADIYIRVTESSIDRDLLLEILNDPEVDFDPIPANTEVYAEFLHRVGALQNEAASWQDYFFPEIHDRPGS